MFKYKLYVVTSEFTEYYKIITRKNELSEIQKENIIDSYCNKIMKKDNCNLALWGCDNMEE